MKLLLDTRAAVWYLRRIRGSGPVDQRYLQLLLDHGAQPLSISVGHARDVEQLRRHHADPFDRLLVVQAQAERATIVTQDPRISAYGVPVLW